MPTSPAGSPRARLQSPHEYAEGRDKSNSHGKERFVEERYDEEEIDDEEYAAKQRYEQSFKFNFEFKFWI